LKLLVILLKQAEVDGSKPTRYLSKLCPKLSISPQTYRLHITTVNCMQQSTRWFNGCLGAHFSKLLVMQLKGAKVDGCKPRSHQSYASIFLSLHNKCTSHMLTVLHRRINGHSGTYFSKLLVILLKGAKVDGCKPWYPTKLPPKLSISQQ
jgi:hypothetical protein